MRKLVYLFLILPLSLAARTTGGVGHGDYHFGYISGSVGYSSLSQNIPEVTTQGDIAWLVGAGYEFRMNNGWVSVGVQYQQEKSVSTPNEYTWRTPFGGEDNHLPPRRIDYYQYTIRQTDKQDWHTIDVPLIAGYYNNGFYAGAGLKVGFSVGSYSTTSGEFDLAAKYTEYVGLIKDVGPYHTYTVSEVKYDSHLRAQVSLLGEIGYDLLSTMQTNSTVCHMLKIGVYGEYGLRSVRPDDSLDPIQLQGMNMAEAAQTGASVVDARITPYYLSTQTAGKRVVPFYIGVKLTYLIGGSYSTTRTWHQGCQCYGN